MSAPRILVVHGGVPCRGTVRTPGEKSISHRAILLGALAEGTSVIHGLSDGADVAASLAAVEAMGVAVERPADGTVVLHGGRSRLHRPAAAIDCGNSGTSMRLLAGLVAGFDWETELVGDESLSGRPMDRVAEPLALMGAVVRGRGERCLPPLRVTGGSLHGIDWTSKVASAQVKSAVLLAGLSATGTTIVREAVTTRTHTEEMLADAGADVTVEPWGEGRIVRVRASSLAPVERTVPGDPSASAFFVVAGCVVPGSTVDVAGVYSGPARLGYVSALQRMGADVTVDRSEPGTATIRTRHGPLRATEVVASAIPSLDEIPALAVAAAVAAGTTVFHDVGELRVKEVDRLAAVVDMVSAFGAAADVEGDDARHHGCGRPAAPRPLRQPGGPPDGHGGRGGCPGGGPGCAQPHHRFRRGRDQLPRLRGRPAAAGGRRRGRPRRALLVAIDGPAGAGKSTVSTVVAEHLGIDRLDTGAMYRAVAALALERGTPPEDSAAVAALAAAATIEAGDRTVIDGLDVTGGHPLARGGAGRLGRGGQPRGAAQPGAAPARLGRGARRGGGRGPGHRVGGVPPRPGEGLPDGVPRGAGPPAARRGARGRGAAGPDRLDPRCVAVARGRGCAPARYDRPHRAGCGRGGVVMAVSTPGGARRRATGAHTRARGGGRSGGGTSAGPPPGLRGRPEAHPLYRIERAIFTTVMWTWFRPKVVGREHVPETGPVILAPVHRSFADFGFAAFCTERKLFFMTKDEMWKNKWLGKLLLTVGAFPVHRESADREALQRAEEVLRKGQALVLFPEGTRREGPVIEDLMEGATFLSARTGAPIVPIGIGGSDLAMPKGSAIPKPRTIQVVIGPAIPPPPRTGGGRVSRSAVHAATEALIPQLQAVYDAAREKTGRY